MKRMCGECPAEVQAVCRHAFGKFWGEKSSNNEGCDHPLDGVAEAWREAGWTPQDGKTNPITLPYPRAPRRRSTVSKIQSATVSMTQLKMPRRPVRKMAQGDLF